MTGGIYADFAAMDQLRADLTEQSGTLAGLPQPLHDQCSDAVESAGDLSPWLQQGVATFVLSWTAAFGKYADCLGLLAEHVGRSVLTLATADQLAADAAAQTVWDVGQ